MTSHPDDSLLDTLAAQVRLHPLLPAREVDALLATARAGGAPADAAIDRLVRHHLVVVLEQAIGRRSEFVELADLFQEGGMATTAAVRRHVAAGQRAAGLTARVRTDVGAHLDAAVAEARRLSEGDAAFVRDSRLIEIAEVGLRSQLGRDATPAELAVPLGWTEERVRAMHGILGEARAINDDSLIPYLDDINDDGGDDDGDGDVGARVLSAKRH